MSRRTRLLAHALRVALLAPLAACATQQAEPVAVAAPAAERRGPALWKVSDADTTIYLFGTVHALPENVPWFEGPIASALKASDTLVTEIPGNATADPAAQQMVASRAVLPAGKSLRDLLPQADRATYEGALTRLGLPVNAFDRFEPWFAGMSLSILPLTKSGWSAASGVEKTVDAKAGDGKARDALETVDYQVGLFDELPMASQIAFLTTTAEGIDGLVPLMDRMVAEWLEGDADGLAELMNQGLTDPVLAQTLLYDRNANWADWVARRMERPGTVFIAVGAGHLAGKHSVQDFLEQRGVAVTRVQ